MFKKIMYAFAVFIFSCGIAAGCACARPVVYQDTLYQVSTINALMEGVLDGGETIEGLRHKGDFGIGTFEGLDGEMVGLDGEFYQVKADGKVYQAGDTVKVPFANVKFFKTNKDFSIDKETDFEHLKEWISQRMGSKNIFYAVKITGKFSYVKTRSVPKQEKPYVSLMEAVKSQKVFELHDVEGTVVGFYFPEYVKGVNMPGFHFHFLSLGKDAGGHVLDCVARNVTVEIDETNEFDMNVPLNNDFSKADFSKDNRQALEKAEK
ncbi:MAG: acetolactate decarboxylase [Candidatus Omnitrophica bacterium]|nr:acetolactate decarboxylase [Candidatus Omnitrophota bacterium]